MTFEPKSLQVCLIASHTNFPNHSRGSSSAEHMAILQQSRCAVAYNGHIVKTWAQAIQNLEVFSCPFLSTTTCVYIWYQHLLLASWIHQPRDGVPTLSDQWLSM